MSYGEIRDVGIKASEVGEGGGVLEDFTCNLNFNVTENLPAEM
jgi:hypothetical protein